MMELKCSSACGRQFLLIGSMNLTRLKIYPAFACFENAPGIWDPLHERKKVSFEKMAYNDQQEQFSH